MKLIHAVKKRATDEENRLGHNGGDPPPPPPPREKGSGAGAKLPGSKPSPPNANDFNLTKLREASPAERQELFGRKLRACQNVFSFDVDTAQREKEAKRQTLLELVEFVNTARGCFTESIMGDVVAMVGANIFRALPTKDRSMAGGFIQEDEDEPMLEKAWPHLQIVYELFLRFVVSNDVDAKVAKHFVNQSFVLKLIDLFDTEDPRERDYLKTILHRVYGKFMTLRACVRRGIQHAFFKVIYECEAHNGVSELLEILGSIINGFALPLKEEHKDFLVRAMIPLHKVKSLSSFHQQLSYCMAQYVEKDPRLSYDIISAMLRFWPVSITSKQVLFLNELEETLEMAPPEGFSQIQMRFIHRIAACVSCPHFQVAERTLFLWNNSFFVKLFNENRKVLFPVIVDALYANSSTHWNSAVHGLTFNVLKLLMEADPQLFDECSAKHRQDEEEQGKKDQVRAQNWNHLQSLYDAKHSA
mmetsp:Transcript_85404/g.183047  ORF Transcript_85404/g.183047 Transcript_85404/m.183047 type:complete len:473 (-) Transcript_85404:114-1532(-)